MRKWIAGLALALSLTIAASKVPAAPDNSPGSAVKLPGGLADAEGKVGYFTLPKGGIVAVDFTDGKALWESKEMERPLALSGKKLVGLTGNREKAGSLKVVLLDVEAKGKKLAASDPIALPDWLPPTTGRDFEGQGKAFLAQGKLDKGRFELKWKANSSYYGGAAPPPEILKAAMKEAYGVVFVDLDTAKVEAVKTDKAPNLEDPYTLAKLSKEQQAFIEKQGWPFAIVSGPRLFGFIIKGEGNGFPMKQTTVLQAIDSKSGKLLWERAVEEKAILPPPP